MPKGLPEIADKLRAEIAERHSARERALADARKIIQLSAKAIKHIHRGERPQAESLLEEAEEIVKAVKQSLANYPGIYHANYLQDAIKEFAEAMTFSSLAADTVLPDAELLGIEPQAFLNGLCEAASECRRYALDKLRSGNGQEAYRLADNMEDIYDELITFDYPDALMSNLRRSVDALRSVLERTQSDLAVAAMQLELIEELKKIGNSK